MKISYNSPVILSFTLASTIILILDSFLVPEHGWLTASLFTVDGSFQFSNPLAYITLVGHIFGHSGWPHLLSNFSYILLIGPLIEEKYGPKALLIMMLATALITALLNIIFFETGLRGASGIVFMFIVLSSLTNFRKGEIPLTFILVTLLFIGQEVFRITEKNNVSEFAHIIGGICGGFFGLNWVKSAKSD